MFRPFTRHLDERRADGTKASLLHRSITQIVYRREGATCANCKKADAGLGFNHNKVIVNGNYEQMATLKKKKRFLCSRRQPPI